MAGAILQYKADGLRVGVLDLTSGEPTPFGSPEIRAQETAAATEILGLDWRGNLGLPNRSLQPTLEARQLLAGMFRRLRPRLIFSPYWVDSHPDHVAAVELIEAARFWSKLTKTDMPGEPHFPERILYYHCVHLRLVEKPAFVLDISRFWDRKLAAIQCFRSQFITGRPSDPPTFVDRLRDQAAYWGWSISAAYGEPFASREPLGLASLRDLV
jgi:bacillithiol biosynthesis deacetylase BshB1